MDPEIHWLGREESWAPPGFTVHLVRFWGGHRNPVRATRDPLGGSLNWSSAWSAAGAARCYKSSGHRWATHPENHAPGDGRARAPGTPARPGVGRASRDLGEARCEAGHMETNKE